MGFTKIIFALSVGVIASYVFATQCNPRTTAVVMVSVAFVVHGPVPMYFAASLVDAFEICPLTIAVLGDKAIIRSGIAVGVIASFFVAGKIRTRTELAV